MVANVRLFDCFSFHVRTTLPKIFSGTKKAAGEPFIRFFRRLQAACHWLGYDKGRIWQLAMNLVILLLVFSKLAVRFVHPFEQLFDHLVKIHRPAVLPVTHGDKRVVHVAQINVERPFKCRHDVDNVRFPVIHASHRMDAIYQFHRRRFLVRPVQFLSR